jgi:hypothetical protein
MGNISLKIFLNFELRTVVRFRSWSRRRIIITDETISFAFIEKENQIDCIPFVGIEFVRKWQDEAVSGVSTLLDADSCHVQHQTLTALHIATMANGYNNGRHYYLSAHSVAVRDALLELLQRNTKVARKRAEAETFFQKVQLKVRRRYESKTTQYFLAGVIVAVRILHAKTIIHFLASIPFPCVDPGAYRLLLPSLRLFFLTSYPCQNFALTVFEVQFVNDLSHPDGSPTKLQTMLDWVILHMILQGLAQSISLFECLWYPLPLSHGFPLDSLL